MQQGGDIVQVFGMCWQQAGHVKQPAASQALPGMIVPAGLALHADML